MKNIIKTIRTSDLLKQSRQEPRVLFEEEMKAMLLSRHLGPETSKQKSLVDFIIKPNTLMKKLFLFSVPATVMLLIVAITLMSFSIGSKKFVAKAYAGYADNLKESVLYQKTEIKEGKDAKRYHEKMMENLPLEVDSVMFPEITGADMILESWTTEGKSLSKIGDSYTLAIQNNDQMEMYVSEDDLFGDNVTVISDLMLEDGTEIDSEPFMVDAVDIIQLEEGGVMPELEEVTFMTDIEDPNNYINVVQGEGVFKAGDKELMEAISELNNQNIFAKLKALNNDNITDLGKIEENGQTLIGFQVEVPMPDFSQFDNENDKQSIDGFEEEIAFISLDTGKQLIEMYFDKETHALVKQVSLSEIDGERFEVSINRIIEEKWIPLTEAGDLFSPEKYNLSSLDAMTFADRVIEMSFEEIR